MPSTDDLTERANECPSGKIWYECSVASPNSGYRGCCEIDACQSKGCLVMSQSSTSSTSSLTVVTLSVIPQAPAATTPVHTTPIPLAAMSTTQPAVATQSADTAGKSPNNTPIIVGIVCGIVAASIITTLIWFFLRRRKQRAGRHSIPTFEVKEGKEYAMARQNSDYEGTHLRPGDGRGYNTPSEQPSFRSLSPMEEEVEVDARLSLPSQAAKPLEKEAKTPTQTHPAYQPIPAVSPDTPTWTTQTETPISPPTPYTPQQSAHPAYHVHKLSQHPAFNPRSSPPRSQPPMWKHPAFRPTSNTPQLDSTPVRPIPRASISSTSTSTPELPAQLPKNLAATGSSSMFSRFNTSKSPRDFLSRDASTKTSLSTYTIPIGLGVVDASPTITPFSPPPPTPQAASRPQSPPPPMKANMNAREDHVMMWDSYGAGNISGIGGVGPSNSTRSERSRRQREIEQGVVAREERVMWSAKGKERRVESGRESVPETPLSAYRMSWMERDSWIRR
ncbi:hypothetical protein GLAREA_05756 [Glarea lozoyensis ATCC 20868]|uniref:Uncharacterized protein n=1 Tax=Glarea lozoyensis (strain ATCC 20868 / MF5171) TaxID=1116229 RepID=S3EDQ8_GLAL2|nr:uncharacterized protein GLAREA_05756 [Glarea lozoyensis ATCC 20868]EPE36418.1 hypothetical protein GLAREA_05756 [Glarea lozoyensis ATCC 20868]